MYRFLVLFTDYSSNQGRYAEGLIQYDGSIYVRGFSPSNGPFFGDMHHLRCSLRDNEDLRSWRIQMIDEMPKRGEQ